MSERSGFSDDSISQLFSNLLFTVIPHCHQRRHGKHPISFGLLVSQWCLFCNVVVCSTITTCRVSQIYTIQPRSSILLFAWSQMFRLIRTSLFWRRRVSRFFLSLETWVPTFLSVTHLLMNLDSSSFSNFSNLSWSCTSFSHKSRIFIILEVYGVLNTSQSDLYGYLTSTGLMITSGSQTSPHLNFPATTSSSWLVFFTTLIPSDHRHVRLSLIFKMLRFFIHSKSQRSWTATMLQYLIMYLTLQNVNPKLAAHN